MLDLESLLKRLIDHRVDFVVVGGYAACAHGVTLLTRDVDICCRFDEDNLMRLQEAVADLHPVHRMTPQRLPLQITRDQCSTLRNLYLATDLGVLDCLGEVLGIGGFEEVLAQSETIDFGIGECRILGLEGLIRAKEAMGRPHDRETVLQLRAIRSRRRQE